VKPRRESNFETGYTIGDGVTHSMLSDWCACRQRGKFHLDGWKKKGELKKSLKFGSMFHHLLEAHYNIQGAPNLLAPWELVGQWEHQATSEEETLEIVKVSTVFDQYTQYYVQKDLKLQFVEVEPVFDLHFGGCRRRGKIDAIIRDATGEIWIMETKTTARISHDEFAKKVIFDPQCLSYMLAVEEMLKKLPAGPIYNIVRNPGLKLSQKESIQGYSKRLEDDILKRPDYYFLRPRVRVPNHIIERFRKEVILKLRNFKNWVSRGGPTYRNEQACYARWECEFVDACSTGTMLGYEQSRVLFQELSNGNTRITNTTSNRKAEHPDGPVPVHNPSVWKGEDR
jgi:hypothetical protein